MSENKIGHFNRSFKQPGRNSKTNPESIAGCLILGVLILIAGGVYWFHLDYNPAVIALEKIRQTPQINAAAQQDKAGFPLKMPEGFTAFSSPEVFDFRTLSDKINGKAELYLPAGFEALYAQRFSPVDYPDLWYEIFIYDMEKNLNAFSVYSAQRRENAEPEAFAPFAYGTENSLFWVHGPFYVEIIASEPSDKTREHLLLLAGAFNDQNPGSSGAIRELGLFPQKNLEEFSRRFIPANAFGFEGLDRIFTAVYIAGDQEFTAFISKRDSAGEAVQKAEEFAGFLAAYGGTEFSQTIDGVEIKMVDFFGVFEAILTKGPYLAGVHEAPDRESAVEWVRAVYEKLPSK